MHNVSSSQDDDENDPLRDSDSASDANSDEGPSIVSTGRVDRRPPPGKRLVNPSANSNDDAEDDEDSSGDGYLPFAAASKPSKDDPAATIRDSPKKQHAALSGATYGKSKQTQPESSESSASSAQQPLPTDKSRKNRGPLSPKQRAELEKLSPRYKKSGSEGSPSMGSSFSDLDDASVTQSALEEALLSNMQHGSIGMGSRMSSLRDALGRK